MSATSLDIQYGVNPRGAPTIVDQIQPAVNSGTVPL